MHIVEHGSRHDFAYDAAVDGPGLERLRANLAKVGARDLASVRKKAARQVLGRSHAETCGAHGNTGYSGPIWDGAVGRALSPTGQALRAVYAPYVAGPFSEGAYEVTAPWPARARLRPEFAREFVR